MDLFLVTRLYFVIRKWWWGEKKEKHSDIS